MSGITGITWDRPGGGGEGAGELFSDGIQQGQDSGVQRLTEKQPEKMSKEEVGPGI